ncbi:hypothetical protein [Pleionea litopenaei]|uniref:Uncharacterized protein n=1 Tax=Pleionea litopenaei TaxID=3070815 RepID=A0AA51RUM0_9GAMM|nr:hypothetical protein [Pleionea sp. HL-JVS1]WMS87897.1 hypothetical protein Q9312_03000 [Pleionea sp. HL-JVS1]
MHRGKKLDDAIEKELMLMLKEGFEHSPITPKNLHDRLKHRNLVKGGLSTLSTANRKKLIALYTEEQLKPLSLNTKEKQLFANRKTRKALMAKSAQLRATIDSLEDKLRLNTQTLINIIQEVKVKTPVKIEHLLAPHLIDLTHSE